MTLKWQRMLQRTLNESRYQHSLRVAGEAAAMARCHGLDEEKAALAGLLHDVARDLPNAELITAAGRYGIPVGMEEEANPIILHAPVGAAILRHKWRLEDEEVLRAIALHTIAAPGMDEFSQLLYLADLIEPGRKPWEDLDRLRQLSYQRLGQAMKEALESNFRYLSGKGLFLHPRALAACEFFKQQERTGTLGNTIAE